MAALARPGFLQPDAGYHVSVCTGWQTRTNMYSKKFINIGNIRKQGAPDEPLLPSWRKVVVPAIGQPYSMRSIEVACRLAADSPDSEVNLVYVIDVPRALALHASLPADESHAQNVLAAGLEATRSWGVHATTEVLRGREAIETLLKFAVEKEIDLLVLGGRPDELRGLTRATTREIVQRAECPVIVDYIAAEA